MRTLILTLSALAICACATAGPIPPAPGDASGYFTVRVRGGVGTLSASSFWVDLAQESHVAVFRVAQDVGAVLMWPYSPDSERTLPEGETNLPDQTSEEQRIARRRERALFPEPEVAPRGARPQSLVLVVASSRPLNLDRYLLDIDALRHDLAGDFIDVTGATSGILELIVENPAGHNWAWACTGTPIWCRGG